MSICWSLAIRYVSPSEECISRMAHYCALYLKAPMQLAGYMDKNSLFIYLSEANKLTEQKAAWR